MDHHYLPQFYLRKWTRDDGRLLRYRRVPTGALVEDPVVPKGTAFEPDLYATPPAPAWEAYAPNVIETDFMSKVDSDASLVLDKLASQTTLDLSDNDRTAWALFLNSLHHRHRDEIFERDAAAPRIARELMAKWVGQTQDPERRQRISETLEEANVEQMARNAHRGLMVQAIRNPKAIDAFKALAWTVLVMQPTMPLVTTDRPLLINMGEAGEMQIVTIPVSPMRLFMGYPRLWHQDEATLRDADALFDHIAGVHDLLLLNEQRCRYVYASRKVDDNFAVGDKIIHLRKAVGQVLNRWPT